MTDRLAQDPHSPLRQALAHHQAGRLTEAESFYRQVLEAEPNHPDALRLMGVLARQRGQLEIARAFLERSVKAKPELPQAHFELALVLVDLNEMEMAISALQRAIELKPRFAEAHQALGNVRAASWHLEDAVRSFQTALEQNPNLSGIQPRLEFVQKQHRDVSRLAEYLGRTSNRSSGASTGEPGVSVHLESRELFPHLLNQLGLTGTGVEIGVKEGLFSEHLLQHWKGRLLYSIDPWREFPQGEYRDSANVSQSEQDAFYRGTVTKLMPYSDRSVIWRLTSKEALALVPDGSLDFCYLDGDHSYVAVRQDIQTWFEKIKPAGIIAGHDYIPDGTYSFGTFGVRSAVEQFAQAKKLELVLSKDKPFPSWFVRKH